MKKSVIIVLLAILVIGTASTVKYGDKYFEITKNLEIFTTLYKEINGYYVDDVDPGKLMKTGIDAMLESLDPYTNYISENQIERYRYLVEGRYDGIGAKVTVVDDFVTIAELHEGYAADNAGLIPGDQIIAVQGESTLGKDKDEVSLMMKGVPGTDLNLTIQRYGEKKPLDITLTRGNVNVPNVPYSGMVDEKIGYIVLTTFTQNAGLNVKKALRELKNDHPEMEGVILDLRNNGGGLLNEAINVSNVFIPNGRDVVATRGKVPEWDRTYKTRGEPADVDIPVAVLINSRTASASEIVSGVLQDYDRGVVLGQRSYGKGLVQHTKDIGYNNQLKLTTSKYYIPSGRCIQSVEYKNGEPVDIPDSLRAVFYTENDRPVLDGGGITPDIRLEPDKPHPIIRALERQHIIFKYANVFTSRRDSIDPVRQFEFDDWEDFKTFVSNQDFNYRTPAERKLKVFEKALQDEKIDTDLADDIAALRTEIEVLKSDDMEEYKKEIIDRIELELASRYYYQPGKVEQRLKDDPEIDSAIAVLLDSEKYHGILERVAESDNK